MLERLRPEDVTLEGFLEDLTRLWLFWPFYMQPFWIAVSRFTKISVHHFFPVIQIRVVDMYLVEGPKILYRLALSALKLFASLAQSQVIGK